MLVSQFRSFAVAFLSASLSFAIHGAVYGQTHDPEPNPSASLVTGSSTVASGAQTSVSINWEDLDTKLASGGGTDNDPIGTAIWEIIEGEEVGSLTGSGASVTFHAGAPEEDTEVTIEAVIFDSATYADDAGHLTKTIELTVQATRIDKLQFQDQGFWHDVDGDLYVLDGGSKTFKAIPTPDGAAWPAGKPVWEVSIPGTGAVSQGDGETKTITFNTIGANPVTAECGNEESATVYVGEFAGTLTPGDSFTDRSLTRVGVGETGSLGVEFTAGVNLSDLKPLTWSILTGSPEWH